MFNGTTSTYHPPVLDGRGRCVSRHNGVPTSRDDRRNRYAKGVSVYGQHNASSQRRARRADARDKTRRQFAADTQHITDRGAIAWLKRHVLKTQLRRAAADADKAVRR